MTRFAPYFLLLCLSCLLPRPATAQQAIKPLAPVPIVVQLVPGDVIQERLVGLDSVSYQAGRRALALVPAGDAALAAQGRELLLTRRELEASEAALRQERAHAATREQQYQQLLAAGRRVADKPPARPLLLDWHFWLGLGAGAAGGLIYGAAH